MRKRFKRISAPREPNCLRRRLARLKHFISAAIGSLQYTSRARAYGGCFQSSARVQEAKKAFASSLCRKVSRRRANGRAEATFTGLRHTLSLRVCVWGVHWERARANRSALAGERERDGMNMFCPQPSPQSLALCARRSIRSSCTMRLPRGRSWTTRAASPWCCTGINATTRTSNPPKVMTRAAPTSA